MQSVVRVTVTKEDVADVPEGAIGPGSMLVIVGTAAGGARVAFKSSGRFVRSVREAGEARLDLEPHEILKPGEE